MSILFCCLFFYFFYSAQKQKEDIENKRAFVAFVGLSDLALSNERYLRHRSLSTVFQTYSFDGALREYDKESFVQTKEHR